MSGNLPTEAGVYRTLADYPDVPLFEKWARGRALQVHHSETNQRYSYPETQLAWDTWCAARAAQPPEPRARQEFSGVPLTRADQDAGADVSLCKHCGVSQLGHWCEIKWYCNTPSPTKVAAVETQPPGAPGGSVAEALALYQGAREGKAQMTALADELTYCLRELRQTLNTDDLKPFYVRLRDRIDAVLVQAAGCGNFQTPTEWGRQPETKEEKHVD